MTPVVETSLHKALKKFNNHIELLICLDFDGCVAELVADADTARPVPQNAAAIEELALLPGLRLAYVSGRPLEALRRLAQPPESAVLVGSHGAEVSFPGAAASAENSTQATTLELSAAQHSAREAVIIALEELATQNPGAWVEHKPAGAAIHVRHISDLDRGASVLNQARSAVQPIPEVHIKEGKQILEVVVVNATKGEAITELREHFRPDAVFFAGDDVTDEQGFAVLEPQDVGVKVGSGDTAASFRIDEPADLATVLNAIRDLRAPKDSAT